MWDIITTRNWNRHDGRWSSICMRHPFHLAWWQLIRLPNIVWIANFSSIWRSEVPTSMYLKGIQDMKCFWTHITLINCIIWFPIRRTSLIIACTTGSVQHWEQCIAGTLHFMKLLAVWATVRRGITVYLTCVVEQFRFVEEYSRTEFTWWCIRYFRMFFITVNP